MSRTRGSLPAISCVPVMLLQGFNDRAVERRAKTGRLIDLVEQLRDILKSRGKPKWNPAPFLEVSDQVFVSVHRSNDLTNVVGAELLDSIASSGEGQGRHTTKSAQSG